MERIDIEKIRTAVKARKVVVTQHARQRITSKRIYYDEILAVMQHGDQVEEYPEAKPYPACLIMGLARGSEPLYVVCAQNSDTGTVYVITVHWKDTEKWKDPWTRRK